MSHSNDNSVSESSDGNPELQWLRRFTSPLRMTRNAGGKVELPKRLDKVEAVNLLCQNFIVNMVNTASIPHATICRAPIELYKLKEGAYTPNLISIGPLHINDEHLVSRVTKDIKATYVYNLFWRTCAEGPDAESRTAQTREALLKCYEEMEKLKAKANECYAEYVVEELTAQRMLVDGCFILELLFRYHLYKYREEHDRERAFNMAEEDPYVFDIQTRATVQHDLLLLGNQLPFFVLQKLFELTVDKFQKKNPKRSLSDYVLLYMDKNMSTPEIDKKNTNRATYCCFPRGEGCVLSICGYTNDEAGPTVPTKKPDENSYRHILDVVHHNYLCFDPPKNRGGTLPNMPRASELDFAGVKFVAGSGNGEDLFEVKFNRKPRFCKWFHRAEFEIPKMTLRYNTESLLRNLIAFEKCIPGVPNHVTSFVLLMGLLVDTEKDVQVLTQAGIIQNSLGTNQYAADLFNDLCKEAITEEFPFAETCREAVKYSELCWPKNIAHVRRTYFASPWTFIAFCVGFIAFGISVAQFILSFL